MLTHFSLFSGIGHCVMGNDRWKARMADTEIECEEYEESEGKEG